MSDAPVFWAEGDDPAMQKAYGAARATFKYFWREQSWEYRRIVPGLQLAAVKAPFSDGENTEHMWFADVTFDGATVAGMLLNSPHQLSSLSEGDAVSVPVNTISDWMYAISDRVYGAFTVNALRSRMAAGERRAHDRAWGFDFGDPDQIELVPGPTVKKPGLLSGLFGRKAAADSAPANPDAEHPMSENMGQKLREHLATEPSMVTTADDRGWTMLHELSLAGSAAGVAALLEAGADRAAKTNDGHSASDLAAMLGWPRVIELLNA